MNRINEFDPFSFIIGILSVIAGIIAIVKPFTVLSTIVIITGILSIIVGIFKLSHMARIFDSKRWIVLNSIIDILVGILMLFNVVFGMIYVAIFFAIMFILDSITLLSIAKYIQNISQGYFVMDLIFAVLGIIIGILLLISPLASALSAVLLLGIFFIIKGIFFIAHSN